MTVLFTSEVIKYIYVLELPFYHYCRLKPENNRGIRNVSGTAMIAVCLPWRSAAPLPSDNSDDISTGELLNTSSNVAFNASIRSCETSGAFFLGGASGHVFGTGLLVISVYSTHLFGLPSPPPKKTCNPAKLLPNCALNHFFRDNELQIHYGN